MKIYNLPDDKLNLAIFFDMDGTLYSHNVYMLKQVDLLIERLASVQSKSFEQMKIEINRYQDKWAAMNGGKKISLGNTFLNFGISMEENIKWREELCRPEDFLKPDKRLRSALEQLACRFTLAVVTNNPVSVAVKTLSVLGVYDILHKIVGLDTCCVSKPDKVIFLTAADLCCTVPEKCVSVGDRFDIDISLPLELGMGGILADGVEDVYELPSIL
jgi:phosphoglycolate phosphatase/putative hydrolase of the HAD superfamily